MSRPSGDGGPGYRLDPHSARRVIAEVQAQQISRYGLANAIGAALESIRAVNDTTTDRIIAELGGIDGDLHDAPARIDALLARRVHALSQVVSTIEEGDRSMADHTPTVQDLLGTSSNGLPKGLRP